MNPTKLAGPLLALSILAALGVALLRAREPKPPTFVPIENPTTKATRTDLIARLAKAPHKLRELPNGYSLTYYDHRDLFPTAAQWVDVESHRSPSLEISLALFREKGPLVLKVTGAQGVKDFLRQDLAPLFQAGKGNEGTR